MSGVIQDNTYRYCVMTMEEHHRKQKKLTDNFDIAIRNAEFRIKKLEEARDLLLAIIKKEAERD